MVSGDVSWGGSGYFGVWYGVFMRSCVSWYMVGIDRVESEWVKLLIEVDSGQFILGRITSGRFCSILGTIRSSVI